MRQVCYVLQRHLTTQQVARTVPLVSAIWAKLAEEAMKLCAASSKVVSTCPSCSSKAAQELSTSIPNSASLHKTSQGNPLGSTEGCNKHMSDNRLPNTPRLWLPRAQWANESMRDIKPLLQGPHSVKYAMRALQLSAVGLLGARLQTGAAIPDNTGLKLFAKGGPSYASVAIAWWAQLGDAIIPVPEMGGDRRIWMKLRLANDRVLW